MLTLALWFLIGVSAMCASVVTLACVLAGRIEKQRRPETAEDRTRSEARQNEPRQNEPRSDLRGRFTGHSEDQPATL